MKAKAKGELIHHGSFRWAGKAGDSIEIPDGIIDVLIERGVVEPIKESKSKKDEPVVSPVETEAEEVEDGQV